MGEPLKNIGRNVKIFVYVEGTKLGRDFKNITKWNVNHEYYEGDDEHLGRGPVRPWKVYKKSTFSFEFEEDNASTCHAVIQSIDDSESNGTRPDVKVVELTENNDGTVSKAVYEFCVIKFSKDASSKGEKIRYTCTGSGTKDLT